ncbi:SRPBCC domain-containing protein [Streptomyces albidochromogenes]|uniref:SRPBCC domain-containing protein n=1 Tax=Streptomyces albidochromogenes TaxID=329524 RepID=UPI00110FB4E0|nr:SRPBCC domain-containing protein [Streptomyces albidochromogenes]
MEHEVFVPVPPEALRQALEDPARVARCVPGLQQDADEESGPLAGRLKVRIDGHTITYRGALSVAARPDGTFAVEGEGTEARGSGAVELALTVRLAEADGGTTVTFAGTASGEGRIAELDAQATESACHRLLERFATRLADVAAEGGAAEPRPESPGAGADAAGGARQSVFDAEVPPPALDPMAEVPDIPDDLADVPEVPSPTQPPAEAAHARRTMIGRSAEEVDHAPPRGRYAPVPAPQSTSTTDTLRWIAPAAALALASAVVVGRVLRRRR